MAPQVLQGLYTSQADLWSMGVITYMLLCGEMPFYGRKRRHVIDKIMRCDYNFEKERFKSVSDDAKKFCSALITVDPKVRLNAEEALQHSWITSMNITEERRPSSHVMEGVSDSLKKFGNYGNFQVSYDLCRVKSSVNRNGMRRVETRRNETFRRTFPPPPPTLAVKKLTILLMS